MENDLGRPFSEGERFWGDLFLLKKKKVSPSPSKKKSVGVGVIILTQRKSPSEGLAYRLPGGFFDKKLRLAIGLLQDNIYLLIAKSPSEGIIRSFPKGFFVSIEVVFLTLTGFFGWGLVSVSMRNTAGGCRWFSGVCLSG